MRLRPSLLALIVMTAPAASAQLVLSDANSAWWSVGFLDLSTSSVTSYTTPLGQFLRLSAADNAGGTMFFVGYNGSQSALYSWPFGATGASLVGNLVLDGSPVSASAQLYDMAFVGGQLYLSKRTSGFSTAVIYAVNPATAVGATWHHTSNLDPRGLAYDAAGDRFIVSNSGTCDLPPCSTAPIGIYAIDRSTKAHAFLAAQPPAGKTEVMTIGAGTLWALGGSTTVIANLDSGSLSWDTTPPTLPPPATFFFFAPGLTWAPNFLSACAGTVYCTAGTSSIGCVPSICASGVASASSPSGFTISVSALDGQRSGLLMYGINGPIASPWAAGSTSFRCVATPVQRMGAQNSGGTFGACDGVMSEDWNAYVSSNAGALGQPFSGGETGWAQGWHRDPAAPKSSGLTNGIEFQVTP